MGGHSMPHVDGVEVGIWGWLGASCIWHHGGSCGWCKWALRAISVSLGVRVSESASEGSEGKGGNLLENGCDHVHVVFAWA